jgi:hypothetical protein
MFLKLLLLIELSVLFFRIHQVFPACILPFSLTLAELLKSLFPYNWRFLILRFDILNNLDFLVSLFLLHFTSILANIQFIFNHLVSNVPLKIVVGIYLLV